MRYYMVLGVLAVLFLLAGCGETTQPTERTPLAAPASFESAEAKGQTRIFEMRVLDNIYDPSEIQVHKGDTVVLRLLTLYDPEQRVDEDLINDGKRLNKDDWDALEATRDQQDRREVRFTIEDYDVDTVLYRGQAREVVFKADKQGVFSFGDLSHSQAKGTLVVI